MKSKIREVDIEREVLVYLDTLGLFPEKNKQIGVFDQKRGAFRTNNNPFFRNGRADVGFCIRPHGRSGRIELKRPSNKTRSIEQTAYLDEINARGGVAFYASSLEEISLNLALRLTDVELSFLNKIYES